MEERVLNALRYHLMDPKLFKEFCDEFTREMNRLRMAGRASIESAQGEIRRIDRRLDALMNMIFDGGAAQRINTEMLQLERRKEELQAHLADAEEPPPLLHPEMASYYRTQVAELYDALQEETEASRLKTGEVLRSLVKEIILTPKDDELLIDVQGDLSGILSISLKSKAPASGAGASQVEMVAGARFELTTFRL